MRRLVYELERIVVSALALSTAAFAACTKDETSNNIVVNRQVEFDVSAHADILSGRGRTDIAEPTYERLVLEGDDHNLYLHIVSTQGIAESLSGSRATPVTTATIADAGVSAFCFAGDWKDNLTPQFMYNVRVAKADGWKTNYRYPNNSDNVRFYAYSPYACKGVTLSGKDDAGVPTIGYTVPTSVAEQQDLLVAVSEDIASKNSPEKVSLSFKHVLSAVKFVTGDDIAEGTIKSIALKGIYTTGKCTIDKTTSVWSDLAGVGNIALTDLDKSIDGSKDVAITGEAQTFMMIPQTLPAGATVEVVIVADGQEHTLSVGIGNSEWKQGFTTTYKVSSSSITYTGIFTVTAPSEFEYTGGTNSFEITSYGLKNGVKEPAKWSITGYSTDDGVTWSNDCPDWLTLSESGAGNTFPEEQQAEVARQADAISLHDDALANTQPLIGVYDLSTKGGTEPMNTANCYVVNAPGTYSLPLVYGNAIKNGATNTSAYTSDWPSWSAIYREILYKFINHLGNQITDPYIYNNLGCEAYSAKLLWQDAPNLINNVALADGGRILTFDVPKESIAQGNAVIAVYDNDDRIMWSWHIWVTDYRLGEGDLLAVNKEGHKNYFMPVNLGWCYSKCDVYPARRVMVRFVQERSKAEQIIAIKQSSHVATGSDGSFGNQPFYQWGRKDPFLPSNGVIGGGDKTWYDDAGNSSTAIENKYDYIGDVNEVLKYCIQHPMEFYGTYSQNNDPEQATDLGQPYVNLWTGSPNQAAGYEYSNGGIAKTIYDPSPVGYSVPSYSSLSIGVGKKTAAGQAGIEYTVYNSQVSSAYQDAVFFFPYTGYRHNGGYDIDKNDKRDQAGKLFHESDLCEYYTGTPTVDTSMVSGYNKFGTYYYLLPGMSHSFEIYLSSSNGRAAGRAIRCMKNTK
ncbi:MAG: fimbrillin family protein [Alistipes sp.]